VTNVAFLTLKNVTLRNGYATYGGAVFNNRECCDVRYWTSLTVNNSRFINNAAYQGGAIFNGTGRDGRPDVGLIVDHGIFEGNSASIGAGIYSAAPTEIRHTIFNGNRAGSGGGSAVYLTGGQYSYERLIEDSQIINNVAGGPGAVNISTALLKINRVLVSGNHSAGAGGGIFKSGGQFTLSDSRIVDNVTTDSGGGIVNSGSVNMTMSGTTVSGNKSVGYARSGGGMYLGGTATITNSTISGNFSNGGGGAFVSQEGLINLNGVTITGNNSGVYPTYGSQIKFKNSIIAANPSGAGADLQSLNGGYFTSEGHNIVGSTSGISITPAAGDSLGTATNPVDPRLAPLAFNGGLTETHALLTGSPAIDAGGADAPATDQRGRPRPGGAAADIGAFEQGGVSSTPDLSINKVATSAIAYRGLPLTYNIQVTDSGSTSFENVNVTDPLPASETFVSASASQGSCSNSGGTVTCNLGTLNSGATATITLVVTPTVAGLTNNTATVASSTNEADTTNNSSTNTSVIKEPITVGGACTLVDAINAANSDAPVGGCAAGSGADLILLPAGTITLSAIDHTYSNSEAMGLPDISGTLTIRGAGREATILERDTNAPAFRLINSGADVLAVENMTFRNGVGIGGNGSGGGGAIHGAPEGAYISVANCRFENNVTYSIGGAIKTDVLVVTDSVFSNNHAYNSSSGGAISVGGRVGSLVLMRSTFDGNTADNYGGAIQTDFPASITDCAFTNNHARGVGGAIVGGGVSTIRNSTFTGNSGENSGGGALYVSNYSVFDSTFTNNFSNAGGAVQGDSDTFTRTSFTGNSARQDGGAISSNNVTVRESTFVNNHTVNYDGGAINADALTLINSTLTGNTAGRYGGAIMKFRSQYITINNDTIAGNTANGIGGGVFINYDSTFTQLNFSNTIIAGNTTSDGTTSDTYCQAPIISLGHNLIGTDRSLNMTPAEGDQIGTVANPIDPLLGPLADNGGTTQTRALLAGSPAIDKGDTRAPGSAEGTCATTDQRGTARPIDGDGDAYAVCDAGAYEASFQNPGGAPQDVAVTMNATPSEAIIGNDLTYTITVTNNGSGPAMNVTLVDDLADGLDFVSLNTSQGKYLQPDKKVIVNVGTLASHASATATLVVIPFKFGAIDNTVSVTANNPDPDPSNNTATAAVTVVAPSVITVSSISPEKGGDNGFVMVRIIGSGFTQGAGVRLTRDGQPDISANPVAVSSNGLTITAVFDLAGKTRGVWNVVVDNPDGKSGSLFSGFTIVEGRESKIWVDVLGRDTVRPGQTARYTILVGNRGTADAYGIPLFTGSSTFVTAKQNFKLAQLPPLPGLPENELGKVPTTAVSKDGQRNLTPLYIPILRAGDVYSYSFNVTVPNNFEHTSFDVGSTSYASIFRAGVGGLVPSDTTKKLIPGYHEPESSGSGLYSDATNKQSPDCLKPESGGSGRSLCGQSPNAGAQSCALAVFGEILNVAGLAPGLGCVTGVLSNGAGILASVCSLALSVDSIDPQEQIPFGEFVFSASQGLVANLWGMVYGCLEKELPVGHLLSLFQAFAGFVDAANACFDFPYDSNTYKNVKIIFSRDPNEKVGAVGYGAPRYITGQEPLRYAVYFENQPNATAPAQQVVITDHLDPAKVDLSTFSFGRINFGSTEVNPPNGLSDFSKDVDLRPAKNLIVHIDAHLDQATGTLTWKFTSLDPATGGPTEDASAGFLPPNVNSPEGDGSVIYFVEPKNNLPSGTEIRNPATIVFDNNAPINTNEWLNTIDNTSPTSHVTPLPVQQSDASFTLQWSGSDTYSGVKNYNVYVSEDGGPYTLWLQTANTSATYTGQPGKTYSFYSIAEDNAENVEGAKSTTEATTFVRSAPVFSNLSSPVITYGTASTILSGKVGAGSAVPNGSVSVTLHGTTQTAAIQSDGSFSSGFDTATLGASAAPYVVNYSYAGDASFTGADAAGSLTVSKASATITLSNLTQSYDGSPKSATATTQPPGLGGVSITYDGSSAPPSAAGNHAVVAKLINDNYAAGDAAGTLLIYQTTPASGSVIISEFRLSGATTDDEYVELYNNTDSALDISGHRLRASTGQTVTVPAATTLPPRAHYLIAHQTGYTLSSYAAPDETYSDFDLDSDAGLILVDSSGALLDAVGFGSSPAPFRQGSALTAVTAPGQYAFVRKLTTGRPQATGDNSQDFALVATEPSLIAGSVLGAPGPENSSSPVNLGGRIKPSLFDPTISSASAPNRVRDAAAVANGSFGTLEFRRTFTNGTGQTVTRLRFRVIDMTAGAAPSGTADLRALSSTGLVGVPTGGGSKDADGLTLEEPSAQPGGGGLNVTLSDEIVTTAPIAPGTSVNVRFRLGVQQTGSFRFFVIVEALTN
jgi:uncharacterized repeat protein (TIGR01451 family)